MPTQNPRIQVMLDNKTNDLLVNFAGHMNLSISSAASSLIREALEIHEDMVMSKHADKRFMTTKKWVSHEEAWD